MRGRASGLGARISSMVGLFIFDFVYGNILEQCAVVLGDLGLDEGDLVLRQPIPLVQLGIRPLLI